MGVCSLSKQNKTKNKEIEKKEEKIKMLKTTVRIDESDTKHAPKISESSSSILYNFNC